MVADEAGLQLAGQLDVAKSGALPTREGAPAEKGTTEYTIIVGCVLEHLKIGL